MSRAETEARLSELALRWEELREAGQDVTPEELCADCPELLEDLRRRVEELRAMSDILGGLTEGDDPDDPRTASTVTLPPAGLRPTTSMPDPADFELLEELGQGGMGVVYRAYDRRRREVVALKTMQGLDAAALDRFKKEFRAAADLSHPNLAVLHELVSEGRLWFFTMELVEGVSFLRFVREGASGRRSGEDTEPFVAEDRWERLRSAMAQLVEGLSALHSAGRLHRDVKPSNVMVRRDGRVVLLDFGLAAELGPSGLHRSTDRVVRGTIAYMSPEQANGRDLSPATDWYSVGVMLYEALVGRLPFGNRGVFAPAASRRGGPPVPRSIDPSIPADLESLCLDLLRDDPAARPTGPELRRRLGGIPVATAASPASPVVRGLVGRERHLAELSAHLEAVGSGRTVMVRVHGTSGAGKSALTQAFLEGLAGREDTVALFGRCYEREAVPYKALDGLIDALTKYLRRLDRAEVEALLPRDVLSLARVFPALKRVEAVAAAPRRGFDVPDPQELRRRAFAALRELLARLGDRRRVVLAIDDLQWGDVDSAAVLADVLRGDDPPALLLIACHRDDDVEASPFLRAFLALGDVVGPSVDWRTLAVGPLEAAEARALAEALLGTSSLASPDDLARESGGNPFFVGELARSLLEEGATPVVPVKATLDEVLWRRVGRLSPGSRRLLEVVAVSGRPLRQEDAIRGAGLSATEERPALAELTVARLIRSAGAPGPVALETYHDRVREALTSRLSSDDLRDRHRRLAEALEVSGIADPEALGVHYRGAGERIQAGRHFARAAARAADALAFERAAGLYRQALELLPEESDQLGELRRRLGDALANAGRGAEAARAYLDAAADPRATVAGAFELRRLAAMQWLISGHLDEGLASLRDVLSAVGMRLHPTPIQTLASLLWHQARLRLRGLGFRRRDVSEVAPSVLAKIDVCWAAVAGLSVVDFIRGADFQARGLLLALDAGEPTRVARAVAMQAAHHATTGSRGVRRTTRLLEQARSLAAESGDPYATGMADLAEGTAAYLEGRWATARTVCDRASTVFRERCKGVAWETVTAHSFALWSLSHLGELAELTARWPALIREAGERGDLYAVMNLNTYLMSVVRIAEDEPENAREELARNSERWPRDAGYHVQHNDELWAMAQIALYLSEGRQAWELLDARWPALRRSLLLQVQFVRVAMTYLRARCAVAAALDGGARSPLLRVAGREARRLGREGVPWASALGCLSTACILEAQGESESAARKYLEAATALDAVDMPLHAAAARRRRGLLRSELDEVARADAFMNARGARAPAKLAAMFAPATSIG